MFSSNRLVTDWGIIETNEQSRKEVVWDVFVVIVKSYYIPSHNPILIKFYFWT